MMEGDGGEYNDGVLKVLLVLVSISKSGQVNYFFTLKKITGEV